MHTQLSRWFFLLTVLAMTSLAAAPSQPAVDAPELAKLGSLAVGVRTTTYVHTDQPNVLAFNATSGVLPHHDRTLIVDIWYPAHDVGKAHPETYTANLPGEPSSPAAVFSIPGIAIRNAPPIAGKYPLVILSHGYSNATVVLSWLTENLASKGYVVAAIRHEDPDISDRSLFAGPAFNRPLDIAFIARTLQDTLAKEGLIDPSLTALVGYSMGGYGVITAAGATLNPSSPIVANIPGGALSRYARGGTDRETVRVQNVKAVVALAPAGGSAGAWDAEGLADISAPLFLIAGNQDHTVDYTTGARAFFDAAVHVPRYLLTFKEGGHAIGFDPVPEEMRSKLWDFDWFEDPVWRKERIIGINLHMITAFLDLYVKGDASRRAYIEGLMPNSDDGQWPRSAPGGYDTYSSGDHDITVWKGFQRNHASGLSLESRQATKR
jgi:predicted dienelactone hydrolase